MAEPTAEKPDPNVEAADKETLYWAVYRLLGAIHAARVDATPEQRSILHIIALTADHWGPQIPGMPRYEQAVKDARADDAHHEMTARGERLGIYLTGDEFF